jgi:carbohydrate-selective porin OprB
VVYRSAAAEGWRRQFGVAVGIAELGAPFGRALTRSGIGVADREAVYELSWRIELSEGFALQSDVQYIRNPGMDATVDSSWTIGLRFELGAR